MKLNLYETHDRFLEFTKKKDFDVGECCQDLINQRPFGNHPFYIYAHARTDDDGVKKRLIWQPRLSRPVPSTNSMLFKAYPNSDMIKVIWMIPAPELWEQYEKGKVTENKTVFDSIKDFQFNRAKLEQPEDDDLTDEQISNVYKNISAHANYEKRMKGLTKGLII